MKALFCNIFKKKPSYRDKMRKVFTIDGVSYYKFIDSFDMPRSRIENIEELLIHAERVMTKNELSIFIDELTHHMEEWAVETDKKKAIKSRDKAVAILSEMKTRDQHLVHPELWWQLAASTIIREDEHPGEWSNELLDQKVDTFRKNFTTNKELYDFFLTGGLKEYIPFFDKLKANLAEVMRHKEQEFKARMEAIKKFRSSQPKSINTEESEEKNE